MAPDPVFDPIVEARRQWDAHGLGEPLAMSVTTSLIRAHQVVSSVVDRALKPLDLTFARYELLTLLSFSRTGALPITKVGERLMVHPTGITKLVDKLAEQGLVGREPNPDDRRGTLARITPAGRELAETASAVVAGVRFGADLPDDDLEELFTLLQKLRLQEPPTP
jgi:DNA-binding MarR family transcriptional regulator